MDDNYGTDQFGLDNDDVKELSEIEEEGEDIDEEESDIPGDGSFGGEEDSDQAEVYNAIFEYQGYDER